LVRLLLALSLLFASTSSNAHLLRPFLGGAAPFTNLHSLSLASASSQYADCGNVGNFTTADSRTFLVWANATTLNSGIGTGLNALISKQDVATAAGVQIGLQSSDVGTRDGNRLTFQLYDGADGFRYFGGPVVTTGAWYFYGVVYTGGHTTSSVTFYVGVGGTLTSYSATSGFDTGALASFATTATLQIGTWPASGKFWNGLEDEVAIYNRALSSSDISAIYGSGHPMSLALTSPWAWLRFEGNYADNGTAGISCAGVNGPTFPLSGP
jgi:hypothetical protein